MKKHGGKNLGDVGLSRLPRKHEAAAPKPDRAGGEPAAIIQLDFSGYPSLYTWLKDRAQEEFRSPEMQILYYLKKAVGAE